MPNNPESNHNSSSLRSPNEFKLNDDSTLALASVESILQNFNSNLSKQLAQRSGPLKEVVSYIFSRTGKGLRPALTFLCAGLLGLDLQNPRVHLLAQIAELIHTASLVHDDLLDNASNRRGNETIHLKWNAKVAIISGDFLFAQASLKLGEVENNEVVKIFAGVLSDLCIGEVKQANNRFDLKSAELETYIKKSYDKTASLFEAACKAPAMLNQESQEKIQALSEFGKNLGIAFQITDDLLDYTASSQDLGKPSMGDLTNGIFNAPVIYVLQDSNYASAFGELAKGRFKSKEDLGSVKEILNQAQAFDKTQQLAKNYLDKAYENLQVFPDSPFKKDLQAMVAYIIERKL
jgi:all-trans-nonaprenyl-diphosphate synthase